MPGMMIVTGGGRGIGAAVARLAADAGYAVAINYRRRADEAETLAGAIGDAGGRALAIQADVANKRHVTRLFERAVEELGTLTALVTCAGLTGPAGRLAEAATDTLRTVLEVNVLGCMLCCREAVRHMSDNGGAIVNVSSGAATLGSPNRYVWYAASKAAVDGFTLGLAQEVIGAGIRVNAVSPGIVDTDIHEAAGERGRILELATRTPIGRMAHVDEIAHAVLWLLSDAASYCVGTNLRVAGGR